VGGVEVGRKRRKKKSTSRAPLAASTHLAAFVATLVWNVTWLSCRESSARRRDQQRIGMVAVVAGDAG
jgi:hypothetical protein